MKLKKIFGLGAVSLLSLALVGCRKNNASSSVRTTGSAMNAQELMILGNQVFKDAYQRYDAKRNCWIVENDKQVSFCMKQASINVIKSDNGDATVYLLATGGVANARDAWGATGMAGLFVIHPENSGYKVIAQSPQVPFGAGGRAPEGRFIQLGKTVGGWALGGNVSVGNPDRLWQIYALNGDAIQDMGTLRSRFTGVSSKSDIDLTAEAPDTVSGFSPLVVTISHSKAGKVTVDKKYPVRYDAQAGRYIPPPGWSAEPKKETAVETVAAKDEKPKQVENAKEPVVRKPVEQKTPPQKTAVAVDQKPVK